MVMPILALIYITVPILLAVGSYVRQIKRRRAFWFIAANITSDFIAFALFAGYWHKGIVQGMCGLAPYLFLVSLFWRVGVAFQTFHKNSELNKRLLGLLGPSDAIAAILMMVGLTIPVYWFAGLAVFS